MMTCQLCGNQNGPWEFADVYDDGRAKVMLICEDCANIIRKKIRKEEKRKKREEDLKLFEKERIL